jgi:hypothetical protein
MLICRASRQQRSHHNSRSCNERALEGHVEAMQSPSNTPCRLKNARQQPAHLAVGAGVPSCAGAGVSIHAISARAAILAGVGVALIYVGLRHSKAAYCGKRVSMRTGRLGVSKPCAFASGSRHTAPVAEQDEAAVSSPANALHYTACCMLLPARPSKHVRASKPAPGSWHRCSRTGMCRYRCRCRQRKCHR